MTRGRPFATVAFLALTGVHGAQAAGNAPLPPAIVLVRYADALATVGHPKNLEFDVAIEQVGLHDIDQAHHVYRSGLNERDEITSVDGQPLARPVVRVLLDRTNRYDIRATAPRPADYALTYLGIERTPSGATAYRFAAAPHASSSYAVTSVSIDGTDFLPTTIHFGVGSGGDKGSGVLTYARAERYWLIREATVAVHTRTGISRERIAWTHYAFPADLPRSTFAAPRPRAATPEP